MRKLEKRAKTKIEYIMVSGGGAQSDEVCQITADMFGIPVRRVQTYETSGLGASICAFVGLKHFDSYDAAIKKHGAGHQGVQARQNSPCRIRKIV
jgi:sugar (pentulose or hexulose) kinase